jgi:hypothetical protein
MDKNKSCFVISPIGSVDSIQRKRADTVLKYIFKPALEPLGYKVVRADEISQPGSITLQVLERVLESEIVIADLTDHNPNVFYELAVRHASQKAVIHVIASDQKIPFDVADLRTISIDVDLEGAERSRQQIVAQAKEIEAGNLGETPVKLAGVLKHLAGGKSDEKVILKQILDGITELRIEFRRELVSNMKFFPTTIQDFDQFKSKRKVHEDDANLVFGLEDKRRRVWQKLEDKFRAIGDSVLNLNLEFQDMNAAMGPQLSVTVSTKKEGSQTIVFAGDTGSDLIADTMFNFMARIKENITSKSK